MSSAPTATDRPLITGGQTRRLIARNWWTIGVYALLAALLVFTFAVNPRYGPYDLRSLALGALSPALAAIAQFFVVLVAGIDLSVGALVAVANVLAASIMVQADFAQSLLLAVVVLGVLTGAGLLNGLVIVLTKIPDIVVTLAMSFVWSGVALLILSQPGGGAPAEFQALATGTFLVPWLPNALIILIGLVAIVWLPIRSRRLRTFSFCDRKRPTGGFAKRRKCCTGAGDGVRAQWFFLGCSRSRADDEYWGRRSPGRHHVHPNRDRHRSPGRCESLRWTRRRARSLGGRLRAGVGLVGSRLPRHQPAL